MKIWRLHWQAGFSPKRMSRTDVQKPAVLRACFGFVAHMPEARLHRSSVKLLASVHRANRNIEPPHKNMNHPPGTCIYVIRSLIFGLVGAVLLAIAGYMIFARYEFLAQAQQAPGIVKVLNAGGSHPEIEFTSADNHLISYPQGGMIFGYEVGQPVQVLYRADNPQATAVIQDKGALWGTPVLLGLMGLFFVRGCRSEFSRGRKRSAIPPLKEP